MYSAAKHATSKAQSILASAQSKVRERVGASMQELKGTVLQAMAKRMDDDDKRILVENWAPTIAAADVPKVNVTSKARTSLIDAPPLELESVLRNCTEGKNLYHPVLGENIADLGYKKIYLTNVRSIALAPVWKKQRILRPDRAKMIVKDKIRNGLAESLAGTITFFMDNSSGEIGIIDGQHRAGALMLLSQMGHWDAAARNVLVEVFPVESTKQVSALFREINAAEPVRLVDLLQHEDGSAGEKEGDEEVQDQAPTINDTESEAAGSADEPQSKEAPDHTHADRAALLTAVTDELAARYPVMFKPSSRCKPPHVNADVLRDDLFQSGFLTRHPAAARSAEALLQLLEKVNARLAEEARTRGGAGGGAGAGSAAEKKAAAQGFYLGLDKAWLYQQHKVE